MSNNTNSELSDKQLIDIIDAIRWVELTTLSKVNQIIHFWETQKITLRINEILSNQWCSEENFLNKCKSVKEKEDSQKIKNNTIIENRAKKYFGDQFNDENKDDKIQEFLSIYDGIISRWYNDYIVLWSDWTINYVKTISKIHEVDQLKKQNKENIDTANKIRTTEWVKKMLELNDNDFKRLDLAIIDALNNNNKLTLDNGLYTINKFLQDRFNERKMLTEKAITYFSNKYYAAYAKKYEKKPNKFPDDREIVKIVKKSKKTDKTICNLTWEKYIIDMILKEYPKLIGIRLWELSENEEIKMHNSKMQEFIMYYYEILKELEIYIFNPDRMNWIWIDFDVESPKSFVKPTDPKGCDFERIQEILDEDNNIKLNNYNKANSRSGREKTIDDIPRYNGLSSIIKQFIEFKPSSNKKVLTKIDVLKSFWFNYVTDNNSKDTMRINIQTKKKRKLIT